MSLKITGKLIQQNKNYRKYFVGEAPPKEFTCFTSFESATQGEKGLTVGILSQEQNVITAFKEYIDKRFYEADQTNLCLFLTSGLLLAYRKSSEWVQVKDKINIEPELVDLSDRALNQLVEQNLEKIFFAPEKDERENVYDSAVQTFCQVLADRIADDVNYLDQIEWRELEKTLGAALSAIGFEVQVTPPSKDGGKDLIVSLDVSNEKHSFIIELKHWRSGKKVGQNDVEKFLRVTVNEKRAAGLFLATNGFTSDCSEMLVSLKKYKVNLGGGEKVYSLFKLYKQSKSGLVLTPQEMLDIFSTGML